MPRPNQPAVVRHPEVSGVMVALDPALEYAASDVFVKAYPQLFVPVDEPDRIVDSVSVEKASAAPGEKRSRTRAK